MLKLKKKKKKSNNVRNVTFYNNTYMHGQI